MADKTVPPMRRVAIGAVAVVVALGALIAVRQLFGYALFHAVVEIYAVTVAVALFLTVWNTRENLKNGYLLWLGIGYACAAAVDIVHTLAYKGMGVFPGMTSSNAATQLWLIARYVQAGTLLTAPFWIRRRVPAAAAMTGLATLTAAGVASVLVWPVFPDAFVEGVGLTPFKVGSEWAIVATLAVALLLLLRNRDAFSPGVAVTLAWSILLTMASELSFTLYTDPYGITNFAGHVLKAASVYLVYDALVRTALREPLAVLFHEIGEAQRALTSAKDLSDALNKLDIAINSSLDLDHILQRAIVDASEALGAESATIVMREGDVWIPRHIHRFPEDILGRPFTDAEVPHAVLAARRMETVAIEDAFDDPRVNAEVMRGFGIRSVLTVPLMSRGTCIGTLYFNYHDAIRRFTEADREFANGLATALALAVENARLFAEQREIADTLQTALLKMPETLPGVELAHDYRAASELARIGGDFYDAFELDADEIAFVLGDVSGKGLEAATATQVARSTFRAFASADSRPTRVLERTNTALAGQLGDGKFITAVFGVLDVSSGVMAVARAGHPAPIVCGPARCVHTEIEGNPPLGIFPDLVFQASEMQLEPGDLVLVYSDGLLDTRKADDGEFFGEERVRSVMSQFKDSGPAAVVSGLMGAVAEFGGGRVTDDVAVFAIRWPGPARA